MAQENPIRDIRERHGISVHQLAQILELRVADVELLERHPSEIPTHLPAQIERLVVQYLAHPPAIELPPQGSQQIRLDLLMGDMEPHE